MTANGPLMARDAADFAASARLGGTIAPLTRAFAVERVTGIEPAWPAWKAGALPLSYTRIREVRSFVHGVGATGLEPAIFCSQSRRASHYATPRPPGQRTGRPLASVGQPTCRPIALTEPGQRGRLAGVRLP